MSLETLSTVKPSRCSVGEGYQDWTLANPAKSGRGLNEPWTGHQHGGVCGRGMHVQVVAIRDEISGGGRYCSTAGSSGKTARPVRSLEKSERSIVAMKARNGAGAKGPYLVDENSVAKEAGDGS